jgi:hypothetical protein
MPVLVWHMVERVPEEREIEAAAVGGVVRPGFRQRFRQRFRRRPSLVQRETGSARRLAWYPAWYPAWHLAQNEMPFLRRPAHVNGAEIIDRAADQSAFLEEFAFGRAVNGLVRLDRSLHELASGDRMAERQNFDPAGRPADDDRAGFANDIRRV